MTRKFTHDRNFIQATLTNGIRVAVDAVPGAQTLAINATMCVGSCHEKETTYGTAHFLEHMAFKGTQRRSADVINFEISSEGGNLNASTDWDSTAFSCVTLKEQLATSLDVLADIMINPSFDANDIELERNVILQEIEDRKGTWATLDECFYTSAYGEQDLSRPIAGTTEGVLSINAESLRSFMAEHYVAGNLIVSVAGDIEPLRAVDLIQDKFSDLKPGSSSTLPLYEYYGGEQGYACSCDQGIVRYGFEMPNLDDADAAAAFLFSNICAYGPTSWLFRELREKRGLVYDVGSQCVQHGKNALMAFHTTGHAAKIREIFVIMHDTIMNCARDLTASDLAMARKLAIAWRRMSQDSVSDRAWQSVNHLVYLGHVIDIEEVIREYEAVNLDRLRAVAERIANSPPTLAAHGHARSMPKLANRKSSGVRKRA
jgi:predicted Zn-dependent peptidase